jgi:hypothetical protein
MVASSKSKEGVNPREVLWFDRMSFDEGEIDQKEILSLMQRLG